MWSLSGKFEMTIDQPTGWFHLGVVMRGVNNGQGFDVYIDAILEGTDTDMDATTQDLYWTVTAIGASATGGGPSSLLADELFIFGEPLDQAHLLMLMNAT